MALSYAITFTNITAEMIIKQEFREPKEEDEASNEDDWQIEMPDGDEIDDIEEARVDENSSPPKNRQKLSC